MESRQNAFGNFFEFFENNVNSEIRKIEVSLYQTSRNTAKASLTFIFDLRKRTGESTKYCDLNH